MNLINNEFEQEQKKNKKMINLIVIIISILVIVCIAIVVMIFYIQQSKLKIYIDGVARNVKDGVFLIDEGSRQSIYIYKRICSIYSKL